jgi:hypothetical protein
LTAAADRKFNVAKSIADCLLDPRDPTRVQFTYTELIRQRLNMILTGNEDLNDADRLCSDPTHKIAAGRNPDSDPDLASDSTLCRLENGRTDSELERFEELLVRLWISRQRRAPYSITIDMDGTNDETHGTQQLSCFNGYYQMTCFQPLFAFIGAFPIVARLRSGKAEPAEDALLCLQRVVKLLREAFPKLKIFLRADAGFARPELYDFCEENDVTYFIGLPANARLGRLSNFLVGIVKRKCFDELGKEKPEDGDYVRVVHDLSYAAESWNKRRRVVARCDLTKSGIEFRYVVTNYRGGRADWIYEEQYCKRARCENSIKELKDFKIDRLSCQDFNANRFRLLMHTFAYLLLHFVREAGPWSDRNKTLSSIRLRLVKVAVLVQETARKIFLHWPKSYPAQQAFSATHARLTC